MTKTMYSEKRLKYETIKILHKMGIPAHLKGYRYLLSAIEKIFYNQEYLDNMTKTLYPSIARENHTTATRVERAIRHAIGVAVKRNKDTIIEMFGESMFVLKTRPTNAECIAVIAEFLYLKQGWE